jgi:hypothetical protein
MAAAATENDQLAWADSKQAWLGRVHDAILPSGIKVTFRDLSLAEFAMLEQLPTDLLDLAVAEWGNPGSGSDYALAPFQELNQLEKPTKAQRQAAEKETRKRFDALAELSREVVAAALVEPKLTADELRGIPMPDLEMLSLLVNRQLAIDAAGRRVGVVPVETFQVVLEAHGHERCAPDCETCEEARRTLATPR